MAKDLGLQSNFKRGLPIQFQCCKRVQNTSKTRYVVAGDIVLWGKSQVGGVDSQSSV